MPKGIPNKRYTPEFKKQVVEAVIQDGLSYREVGKFIDFDEKFCFNIQGGLTYSK